MFYWFVFEGVEKTPQILDQRREHHTLGGKQRGQTIFNVKRISIMMKKEFGGTTKDRTKNWGKRIWVRSPAEGARR